MRRKGAGVKSKPVSTGLTPSEQFVTELCHQAFLKLWTHPNPIGKNGKELCDCLIVCGRHIIIISVKEIQFKETDGTTGWDRWRRKAIDASTDQIWGAERWLTDAEQVTRKDGRIITLPPKNARTVHRIAVSLGAKGQAPVRWGELGHGFVHVCDEFSIQGMFKYHDTITDFINYLLAVESFIRSGVKLTFTGGGAEDLLALYIRNGVTFGVPADFDLKRAIVLVEPGIWKGLLSSPEYKDVMDARESSYAWDNLIESLTNDLLTDGMFDMHSKAVTKNEEALIAMALQPRAYRRELANIFVGLLESKGPNKLGARMASGANETGFVFTTRKHSEREGHGKELEMRCFVARSVLPVKTIIGIATDRPGEGGGHSIDLLFLYIPEWNDKQAAVAIKIQDELGYFKGSRIKYGGGGGE